MPAKLHTNSPTNNDKTMIELTSKHTPILRCNLHKLNEIMVYSGSIKDDLRPL